jgi:hypothetical protein
MRRGLAGMLWVLSATAILSAVQMTLDPRTVSDAIAIGQSRADAERARFHAPYRMQVGKAPVDAIEVVTPFRRVVLHAESRTRSGDRSFGQRQALELLNASPAELEIWVDLTFHPLNTYVGVPAYDVYLIDTAGTRIPPRTVERLPRYGARVEGEPSRLPVPGGSAGGRAQPLLGATVTAQFDGRLLNAIGAYDAVVVEGKTELARTRVDFAKMR